ncbi:MAG: sugar nucleotide-binding protein [Spirochaetaceae bacterium]
MKKVLFTGGSGFIGTRFVETYKNNFEILSPSSKELNIMDREKIDSTFKSFKPDYVIHTAAIAKTDYCNSYPEKCQAINVDGSINIAKACLESKSRMIFLSTEQVFNGNLERGPYNEETIPVPSTVYGKNKLEAEIKIKEILDDHIILRLTWMFGMPGRFQPVANNIFWDTFKVLMKGNTVSVPTNEYRGLTYINELIDNFQKVMEIPPGTYHIGSQNRLSRYEIVCLIFKELGMEDRISKLIIKDEEKYKNYTRDVRLDTSLIQSKGIHFSKSSDAIKQCIKEYNLSME